MYHRAQRRYIRVTGKKRWVSYPRLASNARNSGPTERATRVRVLWAAESALARRQRATISFGLRATPRHSPHQSLAPDADTAAIALEGNTIDTGSTTTRIITDERPDSIATRAIAALSISVATAPVSFPSLALLSTSTSTSVASATGELCGSSLKAAHKRRCQSASIKSSGPSAPITFLGMTRSPARSSGTNPATVPQLINATAPCSTRPLAAEAARSRPSPLSCKRTDSESVSRDSGFARRPARQVASSGSAVTMPRKLNRGSAFCIGPEPTAENSPNTRDT